MLKNFRLDLQTFENSQGITAPVACDNSPQRSLAYVEIKEQNQFATILRRVKLSLMHPVLCSMTTEWITEDRSNKEDWSTKKRKAGS